MSVPEPQRETGKLEVCEKARELAAYTCKITSNPKVFVPRYQESVTKKIEDVAIDIHIETWMANRVIVRSPVDYKNRRTLQDSAARKCIRLLALIDLAKPLFHLSGRRFVYWSNLVKEERKLINGWRDKDAERYRQFRGM